MTTTATKKKGGAGAALSSLLGDMKLDKAAPQARIVEASTSECRLWAFADRPEDEAEHLVDVRESIREHGQIHPALARTCNDPSAPGIKYEIVVGNVRMQACAALGIPLRLEVKDIDDQAAYLIMIHENEKRKGISDYARSKNLAKSLENGLFESKKALSDKANIAPSTLTYHLAFASLPDYIVEALGNMRNISLQMGYRLSQAVKKLSNEEVMNLIPRIKDGDLSAAQLEAMLNPPKEPVKKTDNVVETFTSSRHEQGPELTGAEYPQSNAYDEKREDGSDHDSDYQGGPGENNTIHSSPQTKLLPENRKPKESATTQSHDTKISSVTTDSTQITETDLQRANAMHGRITDRISLLWGAKPGEVDTAPLSITIELHAQLTHYLIKNQDVLQKLMADLKEAAASCIELEAPLDLFDQPVKPMLDDEQVDWTETK